MVFARASAAVGLVGAVLVVIGSIGPWGTVASSSVGGLDGDGWITLVLAVLAGALYAGVFTPARVARVVRWVPLPFALLALLVATIDVVDISSTSSEFSDQFSDDVFTLSVGWGLWLVLAGSILASIASVLLMFARFPRQPHHVAAVPGGYAPNAFGQPGWQPQQPYPAQFHPGQYPPQPYPPQPYAPQPYPGQYPAQPYPPQPYPGQLPPRGAPTPPSAPAPPAWPTSGPAYPGSIDAGDGSSD